MVRATKGNVTLRLFNNSREALRVAELAGDKADALRCYEGGFAYGVGGVFFDENGRLPLGVFAPTITDSELVRYARAIAIYAHDDQLYGSEPYVNHLDEVVGVLRRFGFADPVLLALGYLHDVIEDCKARGYGLAFLALVGIPGRVVELANRLTDEPGRTRKERKAKTYGKIAGDADAIVGKLADRIANVERGGPKIGMYRDEHPAFRTALYRPDPKTDAMWRHLDALLAA